MTNVPLCRGAVGALDVLGDPRTNCTVGNGRLDEEDIDLDNALNFTNAQRESERLLRYVVDLSDPTKYKRRRRQLHRYAARATECRRRARAGGCSSAFRSRRRPIHSTTWTGGVCARCG